MIRDRKLLAAGVALAAILILSGCGFQPVYGGSSFDNLRNVSVSVTGEDRFAYLVEAAMVERLGAGDTAQGRLQLGIRVRQRNLGVSADGEASRIALEIRARYQLTLPGQPRLTGQVDERVAFEAPQEPYALISARTSADRQASEAVAEAVLRTVSADMRRRGFAAQRPDVRPSGEAGDPAW